MQMPQIRNLCKSFNETRAVDHVSLDVEDGEMLCLLGPSGCGKTTLLMSMSGFLTPDEGSILMDGVDVTDLPPERRPTALGFQNHALFPHLTVFENVAFGLRAKKTPLKEIRIRVEEMLEIVGLSGKGGRGINQLSGGQQQRVALARSLVMKPKVLLLDEPLSNLDAKLRVETRQQIRSIQKSVGITSIFVTHDQEEALTMADRIAVMRDGKIGQHGTPQEIHHKPGNRFVADFMGKSNFMRRACTKAEKKYISFLPERNSPWIACTKTRRKARDRKCWWSVPSTFISPPWAKPRPTRITVLPARSRMSPSWASSRNIW